MKRIFFLLLLIVSLPLAAQKGLHVNALFEQAQGGQKQVTTLTLKGSRLAPYRLSLFRSITFPSAYVQQWQVEQLVERDAKGASYVESGRKDGHLYFGFYRLPSRGSTHRYLFYRHNALAKGGDATATLIYMEGKASLEELKQHFGK